jgi:S-adenosylmethionine hydrolase
LRASVVPKEMVFAIAGGRRVMHGETFSAVPPGAPFWYENSNGLIEIAVNLGRAGAVLGLGLGSPVTLGR